MEDTWSRLDFFFFNSPCIFLLYYGKLQTILNSLANPVNPSTSFSISQPANLISCITLLSPSLPPWIIYLKQSLENIISSANISVSIFEDKMTI